MKQYAIAHLKRGSVFIEGTDTYVLNLLAHLKRDELTPYLLVLAKGPPERVPVLDLARAAGIRWAAVQSPRTFRPRYVGEVRRFLKARHIALIHCHGYKDALIGLLAVRSLPVLKIMTVHGRTGASLRARVYERLEQVLVPRFDHIVTCTERMRDELLSRGFSPDSVTTIYPGICSRPVPQDGPTRTEWWRRRIGLGPQEFLIGTVGRLSPEKGQTHLLEAFARVGAEMPRAKLVLVGGGTDKGILERHAARLRYADRIFFTGELPPDEVAALYPLVSLFVLPSLREQVPGSLLEAMAHGRPVVASGVGGIPEILRHEATGLLVPPGDPEALAEAILTLYRDESLRNRLARAAKDHVQAAFTANRFAEQMGRLYLTCLQGRTQ